MSILSLIGNGELNPDTTTSLTVLVSFPMQFTASAGRRYRAQLLLVNPASPGTSVNVTSMTFPFAWMESADRPTPVDIPTKLVAFDANDQYYGIHSGTVIYNFGAPDGITIPADDISIVSSSEVYNDLFDGVRVACDLTLTTGFYWMIFDLGSAPFVFPETTGYTLVGGGPGTANALPYDPDFNTSPEADELLAASWNLNGDPVDIPILVNDAHPTRVQVSLNGTQWSAAEYVYGMTAGDWQKTAKKPVYLGTTTIGGSVTKGAKQVSVKLSRRRYQTPTESSPGTLVTDTYTETLPVTYIGEAVVVRGLQVLFKVHDPVVT